MTILNSEQPQPIPTYLLPEEQHFYRAPSDPDTVLTNVVVAKSIKINIRGLQK